MRRRAQAKSWRHGSNRRAALDPMTYTWPVASPASVAELQQSLANQHYVADRGLAVSLFLALKLQRPLFLEGEPGVGKTSVAAADGRRRSAPT